MYRSRINHVGSLTVDPQIGALVTSLITPALTTHPAMTRHIGSLLILSLFVNDLLPRSLFASALRLGLGGTPTSAAKSALLLFVAFPAPISRLTRGGSAAASVRAREIRAHTSSVENALLSDFELPPVWTSCACGAKAARTTTGSCSARGDQSEAMVPEDRLRLHAAGGAHLIKAAHRPSAKYAR